MADNTTPSPLLTALNERLLSDADCAVSAAAARLRSAAVDLCAELGIPPHLRDLMLRASPNSNEAVNDRSKLTEEVAKRMAEKLAARLVARPPEVTP